MSFLTCVMCGVDTLITQQIQLLHSKNREGETPDNSERWTQETEQSVLKMTGTHSVITIRINKSCLINNISDFNPEEKKSNCFIY